MIITAGILARMALVTLLAVILQSTFFSMIEVMGVPVWLLPAFVTSFGLLGGKMVGTSAGFVVGFISDAMVDAPLGSSSLALMAVGYGSGAFREGGGLPSAPVAGALSGIATVSASLLTGLILAGIGQGATLAWPALSELVLQGLYGVLVGMPIFIILRRFFAPAVVPDGPSRKRRREDSVLGV